MTRTTLNNAFLALLIGVAVGASPFTPHGRTPSLLFGGVTAVLVFAYRTLRRAKTAASPRLLAPPPPLFWPCAAVFAALSAPTVAWMYSQWTASIWTNGHGVFMPLIMAYLTYLILRRDRNSADESSPWGYAFLVPGLALMGFDVGIRSAYLSGLGFVLCLPGFSLLLLGARRTRALMLPLALGLFMVPIPDTPVVHHPLRILAARAVEPLIALTDTYYLRSGTAYLLPNVNVHVTDDCSGLSTLYASVAVAVILAYYARPRSLKLILLAAAFPLAVLANTIRIFILIMLSYKVGPWIMDTQLHPATGAATFVVVSLALFALAGRRTLRDALT